ncbi:hypothetical protein J3R30DRAFT_1411594 [Lentinula aciculospora]|uniref:FCP1 homology domain-containing protein n=1 Tax=Lentinula aciculospora TaxID=153920 RepID=A0A9W9ANT4_9AGAR|nr:hypothetical protein J3R30DRAFT_1411594 [Lentinula aciculospora]
MNYESNHRYYANGSGSNFTFTYNDSIDQAGVPPSRAADPYAEEYPNFTQGEIYQNYQGSYGEPYVDYHARNENHNGLSSTDVHSGIHSQQHTFERPRSRAYSNRSNRNTGRRDHPTIQPERIPVPSSTYLSLAQQPSVHLTDPTQTRKLLILDLNGTLLYREPRARDGRDPYAFTEPRPLRVTHPRPYIPSFKAFLFHPNTRKWLDTMVWSSAQYPNVKDMVSRCFGEEQVKHYAEQVEAAQGLAEETISQKEGLVAIWDRKFLGLSEAQYRNKFQTTKNLAKPWALLPLSTFSGPTQLLSEAWDHVAEDDADLESASGLSSESGLNNTSFLVSLIREGHVPRNDLLAHSALSTLLLDDSPLKARMQPYNHICVPEYEGKFYARDVRIAEADKRLDAISNNHDFPISKGVAAEASPSRDASLGKRKRSRSASPQASPRFRKKHKRFITKPDTKSHHDHILLAVIGLLDALKHESNVAAWIQSEQLFAANCTEDIDLNVLGDEAKRVVEGTDVELDDLYLNSVPEGVEGVAGSTKKIKKERWRNRLRRFGRDNGVSMMSFGSEQSWADSNISFPESVDSENGDDIGVTSNALDKDYEIPPNLSQLTEPASRPITPDVKNASNYSDEN